MKKAMITIEVLISLMILMMVISMSMATVKFLQMSRSKKHAYEDLYIALLSIRDKIEPTICSETMKIEEEFNRFHYVAECERVKSLREYRQAFDESEESGNIGENLLNLYRVKITLKRDHFKKEYSYYSLKIEDSPQ